MAATLDTNEPREAERRQFNASPPETPLASSRSSTRGVSFCSNVSVISDSVDDDYVAVAMTRELEDNARQADTRTSLFSGRWIEVARESADLDVVEVKDHSPLSNLSCDSNRSDPGGAAVNQSEHSPITLNDLRKRLLVKHESPGVEIDRSISLSTEQVQPNDRPSVATNRNVSSSNAVSLSMEIAPANPVPISPLSCKHSIEAIVEGGNNVVVAGPMSRRGKMWARIVDHIRAWTILVGYAVTVLGEPLGGENGSEMLGIKLLGAFSLCFLSSNAAREPWRRRTGWTKMLEIVCSRKTFLLLIYLIAWTHMVNTAAVLWNGRPETDTQQCEEKEEEGRGSHWAPDVVHRTHPPWNAISNLDDKNVEATQRTFGVDGIIQEAQNWQTHKTETNIEKPVIRGIIESGTMRPVDSQRTLASQRQGLGGSERPTDQVNSRNVDDAEVDVGSTMHEIEFAFEAKVVPLSTSDSSESCIAIVEGNHAFPSGHHELSEPDISPVFAGETDVFGQGDVSLIEVSVDPLIETSSTEVADDSLAETDQFARDSQRAVEEPQCMSSFAAQLYLIDLTPAPDQPLEREAVMIVKQVAETDGVKVLASSDDAIKAQRSIPLCSDAEHQSRMEGINTSGGLSIAQNFDLKKTVTDWKSELAESALAPEATEAAASERGNSVSASYESCPVETSASAALSWPIASRRLSRPPLMNEKQPLCFESALFLPHFDDNELAAWRARLSQETESGIQVRFAALDVTRTFARRIRRQFMAFRISFRREYKVQPMLDSLFDVWTSRFWA